MQQDFQKLYGWPAILESTSKKLEKITLVAVWLPTHTAFENLVARQKCNVLHVANKMQCTSRVKDQNAMKYTWRPKCNVLDVAT